MKKLATLILITIISATTTTPSLAKRTPVQRVLDGQRASVQKIQTATKSVLAHAASRTQRRLLVINELIDDENDNLPGPDELDLHGLYDRARIVKSDVDDDISDLARVRLAIARAKALEIYQNKWA